jgi:hypothetical protein
LPSCVILSIEKIKKDDMTTPTLEEINNLCRAIAEETLDADYESLQELELQKQYEFMQYADEAADLDAEYYGVA